MQSIKNMKRYQYTFVVALKFSLVWLLGLSDHLMANTPNVVYKCSALSRIIEIEEGLPPFLLSAITFVESSDMPWVIGVKGVAYRFRTKEAAIKKVKELTAGGVKNLDIGCMQVNYYFHSKSFASLDSMFHPVHNIRYAAKLIKSLYDETKSWEKAIAYYNSRDLRLSTKYQTKVVAEWGKQKLRTRPTKDSLYLFANIPKAKVEASLGDKLNVPASPPQSFLAKAKAAYLIYKKTLVRN